MGEALPVGLRRHLHGHARHVHLDRTLPETFLHTEAALPASASDERNRQKGHDYKRNTGSVQHDLSCLRGTEIPSADAGTDRESKDSANGRNVA
jgi:hypothetical protein